MARIDDACAVPGGSSTHSPAPKDATQVARQNAVQMDEGASDAAYNRERETDEGCDYFGVQGARDRARMEQHQ